MWKLVFFLSVLSVGFSVESITPAQALDQLMEGNTRYLNETPQKATRTYKRRKATITQQDPFAIIVACSDSRVAPEILFDAGIGDLFVIRLAGNVVGQLGVESANYAAALLKTPLILVMGHENCGAVKAVIKRETTGVSAIAEMIAPAVKEARESDPANLLEKATKLNALNVKQDLLAKKSIKELVNQNKLAIHAAYYDFDTGKVELLD